MSEYQEVIFSKLGEPVGEFFHRNLAGANLWIRIQDKSSVAFYDECAHMGAALTFSDGFTCKSHGWSYDKKGENLNKLSPNMRRAQIISENQEEIRFLLKSKKVIKRENLKKELKISVLSHACILLEYDGTQILFDPWLKGPAYYGSWHLQPNLNFNPSQLKVDAIIITHPHPDHFHLETLSNMNSDVPIFFPGFPSKIIDDGLASIGWKNTNRQLWNCEFQIGENIFISFIQPRSFWEDSAVLIRVVEDETVFTWLSMVDAGSVIDEYSLPDLDLLSSAFDQGASGYPLTWKNLTKQNQVGILREQQKQTLMNLPLTSSKLKAKYFLPYAGHWKLGLPEHADYAAMIPHTSFDELSIAFKNMSPEVRFLGLYPGDSFEFLGQKTTKVILESYIQSATNPMKRAIELDTKILSEEFVSFESHMRHLVDCSELFNSEHVVFEINVRENAYTTQFEFGSKAEPLIHLSVEIPVAIFKLLASNRANWDHIAIGYWGIWSRKPNRYPSNFMRLLQSGVPSRYVISLPLSNELEREIRESSIADLIESNPPEVSNLLTRVGLPCGACSLTNMETLNEAIQIHNIDLGAHDWFLKELAAAHGFAREIP